MGVASVVFFIVTAATPMTVVAGVVTTGFAMTGLIGIPVGFLVIGAVLMLFSIGYVRMARYVTNAGAFYAYIARGIGRPVGVGGAWIALLGYNALQVGLYGLLGSSAAPLLERWTGVLVPWWGIALLVWALVALLGQQAVDVNGRFLAILLVAEVAIILVLSVSNLLHPADGLISVEALSPAGLVGPGSGAILGLAVLGFIGFEAATVYAEESRDPLRTVPRATYLSVAALALLYTLASWAMTVATGTDDIVAVSREQGVEVLFSLAGAQLGATVANLAQILLITSIVAAAVSFHNTVARYMFSLGRDGALPSVLGRTSSRSSAPRAASAVQSTIGLLVIVLFAVTGLDPQVRLFFYGGTSGGLGVLILLVITALAIVRFFARGTFTEGIWSTRVAPVAAVVVLVLVLSAALVNFDGLLGTPPGSVLPWLIPTIYGVVGLAGIGWGLVLARKRPQVYAAVGAGPEAAPRADRDGARAAGPRVQR
nr:APC family permease [Brachybacterium sacelli]